MIHSCPLVTVIIPAYNHEVYVSEAINSVLCQSYPNIELIIVNDGSIDKTGEIAFELAEAFGFRYLSQENQGVMSAIRNALAYASGEFVAFLASDDIYTTSRIEDAVRFFKLQSTKVKAIYGSALIIDGNSKCVGKFNDLYPPPYGGNKHCQLVLNNWINAASVTYRREFLSSIPLPPEIRIEDWYFLLQATLYGEIRHYDKMCAMYRIHGRNAIISMIKCCDRKVEMMKIGVYIPKLKSYMAFSQNGGLLCSQNYINGLAFENLYLCFLRFIRKWTKRIMRKKADVIRVSDITSNSDHLQ